MWRCESVGEAGVWRTPGPRPHHSQVYRPSLPHHLSIRASRWAPAATCQRGPGKAFGPGQLIKGLSSDRLRLTLKFQVFRPESLRFGLFLYHTYYVSGFTPLRPVWEQEIYNPASAKSRLDFLSSAGYGNALSIDVGINLSPLEIVPSPGGPYLLQEWLNTP